MRWREGRRGFVVLGAALLAACVGPAMPPVVPEANPALREELRRPWLPAADEMRCRARAVLERGGEQSTLTLLALLKAPDSMRLVGLSDTGPTIFDAVAMAGEVRFAKEPGLLPTGTIRDLTRDLAALLVAGPADALRLARQEDGGPALWRSGGWREVLILPSDDDGARDVLLGTGGRLDARATLAEWTGEEPWRHPSRISLADAEGGYALELFVHDWKEATIRPEVFAEPQP